MLAVPVFMTPVYRLSHWHPTGSDTDAVPKCCRDIVLVQPIYVVLKVQTNLFASSLNCRLKS